MWMDWNWPGNTDKIEASPQRPLLPKEWMKRRYRPIHSWHWERIMFVLGSLLLALDAIAIFVWAVAWR